MNPIRNPLDFNSSLLRIFIFIWLAMTATYYLTPSGLTSLKTAASIPIKYLCNGSIGIDESFTPPIILSIVIAIIFVFIFARWGEFESPPKKYHTNGSSIAGAAFLFASLCLFATLIVFPCSSPSEQNGMGLAKFGYVFLSWSKLSFITYALLHSLLISYFYHNCVTLIRTQRK